METPNITSKDKKAIGSFESIISALGGAYLLYDALKKPKKNLPEAIAGGFMLYRGIKGIVDNESFSERIFSMPNHKRSNINIHTRLIVNRPPEEVYNFWRNLANLPLFMEHVESITVSGDMLSEWKVKVPALGKTITWSAEIVAEEPHRFIGWRSLPGSELRHAGKVEFKNAGELGTLVHVTFSYHAPLGVAGGEIARMLNPVFEKMVRNDIMGFKRYMETGTPQRLQQEKVAIYT